MKEVGNRAYLANNFFSSYKVRKEVCYSTSVDVNGLE